MSDSLICRTAVIKVASRCNLNCSYCYMYNMGDSTYRMQPKSMDRATAEKMIDRIAEHCETHSVEDFLFVFHGGEPLLVDKNWYVHFAEYTRQRFAHLDTTTRFGIQTNGVLLDDGWCQMLKEIGISVGVSLDGTREDHDFYRKDHAGRGSYEKVVQGLNTAKKYHPGIGIIAVINILADPRRTYAHLRELDVRNIHLLLPDANYEQLPPGNPDSDLPVADQYAEWLMAFFDAWWNDAGGDRPTIRMFKYILHGFFGGRIVSDSLGNEETGALVIETNGDYESLDSLKICGDGFTKADANVHRNSIDEALASDLARTYHLSHTQLPAQCQQCPINEICGGGNLPHRYRHENKFDNPTVYCRTNAKLISDIQQRWLAHLPESLVEEAELEPIFMSDIEAAWADAHVREISQPLNPTNPA